MVPAAEQEAVNYDPGTRTLTALVQNAGRGPALHLRANLDPGGLSSTTGAIAALPVGQWRLLRFTDVENRPHYQLIVDYRDLAERTCCTSMTIDLANRAFYDTRLFNGARTQLGDAVYPQPGLRDLSKEGSHPSEERGRKRALLGRRNGEAT